MNDIFDRKFLTRPTPPVIEKDKVFTRLRRSCSTGPRTESDRDVKHFYNSYFIFVNHILFFLLDLYILCKDNKPLWLWLVRPGHHSIYYLLLLMRARRGNVNQSDYNLELS